MDKLPPVTGYLDDCIDFLRRLVQTPPVNERDHEAAIVQLIVAEAKNWGCLTG